jgi:acyltransferase
MLLLLGLTVLNLLLLVPVIFVINNYFPFILGKKRPSAGFEGMKVHFRKLVN